MMIISSQLGASLAVVYYTPRFMLLENIYSRGVIHDNYHIIRKDCFQNKSKFITEDYFLKHVNITIR
jgi:hypothetical protein